MTQSDDLPLPDFDQMSLGDLRHRIRSLDKDALLVVVNHECGDAARVPVLEVREARLRELDGGAEPAPGDRRRAPRAHSPVGRPRVQERVQESGAAESKTPLRHGVAFQKPNRGLP